MAKNKERGLHLCRYPSYAAGENSGAMESREIDTGDSKMKRSSVYLQSPFPYFGGKSKIAPLVWDALGQPRHYIEPFFGSGAVLLMRPNYDATAHTETICDKDGFVCNVWRALTFAPDEVAKWCDWPVNHVDLSARRKALLRNEETLLQNLIDDEKYCDPIMAGYWIWGASCWIGGGLTRINARPHLGAGMGVHKIGQIPHIGTTGMGVHRIGQIPHIGHAGKGVCKGRNINIYKWFNQLSERLRYVRVVCGDWTRVCGGNWQNSMGDVGIFFDPPYGIENRTDVYSKDSHDVAHKVREWCIERGAISTYRIVLCGYEEHEELLKYGWTSQKWKARGGYANISVNHTQGKENSHREVIYFSPFCSRERERVLNLFEKEI